MISVMNDAIYAAIREKQRLVERHLIGSIEAIEGHVPTAGDIAKHSRANVQKDGSETYYWKGKKILIVSQMKKVGTAVVGWNFETTFKEPSDE